MRCLGLILLLLARIESLTCPDKCTCVAPQLTCYNVTDVTFLRQVGQTSSFHAYLSAFSSQTLTQLPQILPHLTDLVISHSDVTVRDSKSRNGAKAVEKCNQLESLVITNSSLTTLPFDLFYSSSCITSLDLSGNLIENLPVATFDRLVRLISLDLHNNRLKTLDERTFRSLESLQNLDLSRNDVSRVAPTAFQSLASLVTLSLAGNPLTESGLVLLGGAGRQLKMVDVSHTGLSQVPTSVEQTVTTLEMRGNTMTSIRCGDLDSYALLVSLDLNGNVISAVEDDAMGRLERLTRLVLARNLLTQVPKSLPDGLQLLDLSYNAIRNISKSDFVNLPHLKQLYLAGNALHAMDVSSLSGLSSLKTLDLSRNPLLVRPPVKGLDNLEILNLEHSPALSQTFLSDTLTSQHFPNLIQLNVSFANLSSLRDDLASLLPALRVLALEGNPWHCDCHLLFAAQWLKTIKTTGARCATPARLSRTFLIKLSPIDFQNDCDVARSSDGSQPTIDQESLHHVAPVQIQSSLAVRWALVVLVSGMVAAAVVRRCAHRSKLARNASNLPLQYDCQVPSQLTKY